MKWIVLTSLTWGLSACGFTNTEVIGYRQVVVAPTVAVVTAPAVRVIPAHVTVVPATVQMVNPIVDTVSVVDEEPVDVTTSSIDFY